jgi:hypothetical protein
MRGVGIRRLCSESKTPCFCWWHGGTCWHALVAAGSWWHWWHGHGRSCKCKGIAFVLIWMTARVKGFGAFPLAEREGLLLFVFVFLFFVFLFFAFLFFAFLFFVFLFFGFVFGENECCTDWRGHGAVGAAHTSPDHVI